MRNYYILSGIIQLPTDRSVGGEIAMPNEKIDTRTRILMAAIDLFKERSYRSVSVDEIAKKAGVSKGGLFHHFSSKYELGSNAITWWAQESMHDGVDETFFNLGPKDQLKVFIDQTADMVVNDVNMGRLLIDVYEEAMERNEDLTFWLDFLNQYAAFVQEIFEKMGCKRPRARALLMLSGIDGFALYYIMMHSAGETIDMEEIKQELYSLYVGDE